MYIYETINYSKQYPANVFIASIDHSSFHWHLDYELILVLKGTVVLTEGTKTTVLKGGDIYLINTKSIHALERQGEPNLCLCIQINSNFLKNPNDLNVTYFFYLNSQDPVLVPGCGYEKIRRTAARIGQEWRAEKPFGFYRLYSLLYEMAADLFEYSVYDTYLAADYSNNEDNHFLVEILNYIQDRYQDEQVLEEVCKEKGIGEKNLYKLLKKRIGMTPNQFLLKNRIEHAKYLLSCTNKSVDFIVDDCGFGSESTFFRVFKQIVGTTPLKYRKKGKLAENNPELKNYLDFSYSEANRLLYEYVKEG